MNNISSLLIGILLSSYFCAQDLSQYFKIYDKRTKSLSSLQSIVARTNDYDILFFGEEHNDSIGHFIQDTLYKALIAEYKNVTLSMLPGGNQDPAIGGDWSRTSYYMRKFQNANNQSGVRRFFPIVRLAEIYLNYAEALNEADGPVAEVYNAMNPLRRRAGITEDLPAGMDKHEMRRRIRDERAVELAFEKQRFWDARRWKKGPEILYC